MVPLVLGLTGRETESSSRRAPSWLRTNAPSGGAGAVARYGERRGFGRGHELAGGDERVVLLGARRGGGDDFSFLGGGEFGGEEVPPVRVVLLDGSAVQGHRLERGHLVEGFPRVPVELFLGLEDGPRARGLARTLRGLLVEGVEEKGGVLADGVDAAFGGIVAERGDDVELVGELKVGHERVGRAGRGRGGA